MSALPQQRQAIEGALRAMRDRKLPRAGEMAAIIAGLDAAKETIQQVEIDRKRVS